MERLKKAGQKAVAAYKGLSVPQRLALGALGATVAIALVLLVAWGAKDDMEPVFYRGYGEVDAEQASRIEAKLTELKIPYEYRNGILHVSAAEKERVVAALYAEPGTLPKTDEVWSWIWEPDWTGTEQKTKRKVTISLEKKLERMISSFEVVKDAKIQVSPGDENRTFKEENPARASVLLKLKGDEQLNKEQVLAISRMLLGAIQDLAPKELQVSDTSGRYYKIPDPEDFGAQASDYLELKQAWDAYYVRQARGALGPLGEAAYVTADVELDMTPQEKRTHTVPKESVIQSERTETEEEKSGVEGPAEPGVVTNTEEVLGTGSESTSRSRELSEVVRDYDTTDILERVPPGRVKSKRIVVYLPYKNAVVTPAGILPEDETTRETNRQAAIQKYQQALATLADIQPGEIHVDILQFPEPAPYPERPAGEWALYFGEQHGGKILLGGLAAFALLLVARVMRKSIPPRPEEVVPIEEEKLDANVESLMRARTPGRFDPKTQVIRDKIQDIIDENPRGASALLRQWVRKE